ncbi:carbon starvation protein A, partial [Candidatus Sumerlaeota bacterium]|nr:carbon starvation protein A [Candidatus Sumerlaeota bacterium]
FLGAVHDFGSLFISLREGAKSVPTIARKTLGPTGYVLFILFFLTMITLVTSAFLNASAAALTSIYPLKDLRLAADQTLLRAAEMKLADGSAIVGGVIGGIASTSVFVITALAIPLGWLQRRQILRPVWIHLIGTVICVLSVVVGFYRPVALSPAAWRWVLAIYTLVAAGLPLWLILQPRDVINVQILYAGMALLFASLLVGGTVNGLTMQYPALSIDFGFEKIGMLWPFLFITVACGAISGFHCMVSGGTTSRQLARESDARRVAYNAMLLESLLAILVILTVASSISMADYGEIVWSKSKPNPIFGFALAAGNLFQSALGIPLAIGCVFGILTVEGFIVTTLDMAVRLNRYLFEELWDIVFASKPPAVMKYYWFNAALSVGLMLLFAIKIRLDIGWLLFGTANQMVAAFALIVISAWLLSHGRRFLYTLIPTIVMLVTTMAALLLEVFGNYPRSQMQQKPGLYLGSTIFLTVLAVGVILVTVRTFLQRPQAAAAGEAAAQK